MADDESYLLNVDPVKKEPNPNRPEHVSSLPLHRRLYKVVQRLGRNARKASAVDIVMIVGAIILVMGGLTGETLFLNFWLQPQMWVGGGPFTVLTATAGLAAIVFALLLGFFTVRKNRGASFMLQPKAMFLGALMGFFTAANGICIVYATPNTPEQFQAVLLAVQVVFTFAGMCIFVPASAARSFGALMKSSNTIVLGTSFALCIGGIFVALLPQLTQGGASAISTTQKYWTLIFAAAMIPGALYNVAASYYLKGYILKTEDEDGNELLSLTVQHDPVYVKFAMLGVAGVWQLPFLFMMFPVDWNSFYGNPPYTAAGSRLALSQGWQCIFDAQTCPGNGKFFAGFLCAYIAQYLGTAVLNRYSSTLAAMVSQIASPVTSVMLLIFPALRVGPPVPLQTGPTIAAIFMLTIGAVLYFLWEESIKQEDEKDRIVTPLLLISSR